MSRRCQTPMPGRASTGIVSRRSRRTSPSAHRSRCRSNGRRPMTGSSQTTRSRAQTTPCRSCAKRRVESSRSSHRASRPQPPTAASTAVRTTMPSPRSSLAPPSAQRPSWISPSSVCSSSWSWARARRSVPDSGRSMRRRAVTASAPAAMCAAARRRKSGPMRASASSTTTASPRRAATRNAGQRRALAVATRGVAADDTRYGGKAGTAERVGGDRARSRRWSGHRRWSRRTGRCHPRRGGPVAPGRPPGHR